MPKRLLGALLLGVVALVMGTSGAIGSPAKPHPRIRPVHKGTRPTSVVTNSDFAVSQPLRSLRVTKTQHVLDKTWASHSSAAKAERKSESLRIVPHSLPRRSSEGSQTTAHAALSGSIPVTNVVTKQKSFEGVSKNSAAPTEFPPDPNGAVGQNQYVEMVNSVVAVYDKTSGTLDPRGTFSLAHFWNDLGVNNACAKSDDGDPIVLYDGAKDRWVLSQFALGASDQFGVPTGPFHECIAVSTSNDPLGTYYEYSFKISDSVLPDYPKLGVWNDGYYMTSNRFHEPDGAYRGSAISVFDRNTMTQGIHPAAMVDWNSGTVGSLHDRYGMLPATNTGTTAPATGKREYVIGINDDAFGSGTDSLYLYKAVPDWTNPSADSRLTKGDSFAVKPFNSVLCSFSKNCIPQKDTSQGVDAVAAGQLMYPFAYRELTPDVGVGDPYGAYTVNQTVNLGSDRAGVRWYELANGGSGTGPALYRQGTVGDTSKERWLGSASIDKAGDVALGYSTSSSRVHPSIRVTARDESTTGSKLGAAESILKRGQGSQTAKAARWGDYSSMSIDPDGCTFWYVNEFYPQTSLHGWHTSISSFVVPGCATDSPPALGSTAAPMAVTDRIHVSRLSAKPNPFSPNGDGHKDRSRLRFHVNRKAHVTVSIYRNSHKLGRIASGTIDAAGSYFVKWGGRVHGHALRADTYRFKVTGRAAHHKDSAFHRVTLNR